MCLSVVGCALLFSTGQLTTRSMPNHCVSIDGTTQPQASGKLTTATQAWVSVWY